MMHHIPQINYQQHHLAELPQPKKRALECKRSELFSLYAPVFVSDRILQYFFWFRAVPTQQILSRFLLKKEGSLKNSFVNPFIRLQDLWFIISLDTTVVYFGLWNCCLQNIWKKLYHFHEIADGAGFLTRNPKTGIIFLHINQHALSQ